MPRSEHRPRSDDAIAVAPSIVIRLRGILLCVILVAPLLCSGCESDEIVEVPGSQPTIVDFSGSDQVTSPGGALQAPLSIVVTVDGGPAEGVDVSWSTQDGTLSGASKTNASGIAAANWTLAAGGARRFAVASGRIGNSSVNFVAFVVPADDAVVLLRDSAFEPSSLIVLPGTTVTWIWPSTAAAHNVEPVGGSVLPSRSGDPVVGPFLYSQEIPFSGVFNYQCAAHGTQATLEAGP